MLMRRLCNCGAVYSTPPNLLQALVGALVQVAAQQSHSMHAPDQHPPQPSVPLLPCALQGPSLPPTQLPPRVPLPPQQPPLQPAAPLAVPQGAPPPAPRDSPAAARPSRAGAPQHDSAQGGQVPSQHPAPRNSPLGPPPLYCQPSPLPSAVAPLQPAPPAPSVGTQRPSVHGSPATARPLHTAPHRDAPQHNSTQGGKMQCSSSQDRRATRNRAAHSRRARRRTSAAARGRSAATGGPPRLHNHAAEQRGEMSNIPLPPCSTQHECWRRAPRMRSASALRRLSFGQGASTHAPAF